MDAKFWHERWKDNNVGFHLNEVNPHLIEQLETVKSALSKQASTQCFIPLCGKSNDINFLAKQFDQVIGVELSELAVEQFFNENNLEFEVKEVKVKEVNIVKQMQLYQAGNIKIYQGDFFALTELDLGHVDFIYDRAALVALPQSLRVKYVESMKRFMQNSTTLLFLIAMSYHQNEMDGPPFSVPEDEIKELFGSQYNIVKLTEKDLLATAPKFKERGLTKMIESLYTVKQL